ncbi:hypothetical protein SAMN04488591_1965 [Microbacterium azadirachtae]|uniref:DUF4175 domain-containing protein n=1 Tax=Microbacterium azadirachtae TaxID=582680 RepID=A0A1I6HMY1_9MICO|nr:hypothetical protein [Microbacterium azadirachtae]SFR55829.1 hypothetical protein SAMN04488591_1965 [Microbacterium azadirachtae]
MYAAFWRILPGPWWVRLIIGLALLAAVLSALMFWVFPWVSPLISPGDVSIEPAPTAT